LKKLSIKQSFKKIIINYIFDNMERISKKYQKDDCMYKFRTKKCCNRKCRKGKACFNYHSKDLSRRVPKQIPTQGNILNYIPQACPDYKKNKKCAMGNSC